MKFKLIEELLDKFKVEKIDNNLVKKYQQLKHIRVSDNIEGYAFFDNNDNLVGFISVENKGTEKWIQGLEVEKEFRNKGIGKELLDFACNKLNARCLSVRKTNTVALNMYKKYGFEIFDETDYMYFMKI